MKRPPQSFVARIRRLGPEFTTQDALDAFPDLGPSSVRVYLSQASHSGIIDQVGFKQYRLAGPPADQKPLSPFGASVLDVLKEHLMPSALEQLLLWSEDDLAPYSHDAIMDPYVVIEGPQDVLKAIHRMLESRFWITKARSRMDLGRRIWTADWKRGPPEHVFLLGTRIQAGDPSKDGIMRPRPAHLMATAIYMPELMPDIGLRMLEHPRMNHKELLGTMGSHRGHILLGAFLEGVRRDFPDHPAANLAHHLLEIDW